MRGHVRQRGKVWYAVLSTRSEAGRRKTIWKSLPGVTGRREAERACARVALDIHGGNFAMPNKHTVETWLQHWVDIGCPGRKRKPVSARSKERYREVLYVHIVPKFGHVPLQKLKASQVDSLYADLAGADPEDRLSDHSLVYLHTILNSCLNAAVRAKELPRNPLGDLSRVPSAEESEHGTRLDAEELAELVQAFRDRNSPIAPIVAVAAYTGARRGEILALRWSDFNAAKGTLSITRSVDQLKTGLRFKGPKKPSHARTITIAPDLVELLNEVRRQHQRIVVGIRSDATVDLSLVKLPDGALIFPNLERGDFTTPRSPRVMTMLFKRTCQRINKQKFGKLRFHDLRGSHETLLLDGGVPVHVVAGRCGHDPATLLRFYAKRTAGADEKAAVAIQEALAKR